MKDIEDFLEADEVKKILKEAENNTRDYLILRFMWECGLRVSEVSNLRYSNIEWDNNIISIVNSKFGESRRVPFNETTKIIVKQYCHQTQIKGSDRVFKITRQRLFQMVDYYAHKAGFENVHPHTFRHSFAINCVRNGMDVSVLSKILGHKNLSTTLVYLRYREKDVVDAYQKVRFY